MDIEKLLEAYKKELANMTERCMKAEIDRDIYHRLYDFESKEKRNAQKEVEALKLELKSLKEKQNPELAGGEIA